MLHRLVAWLAWLPIVVPGLACALDLGPIEVRSAQYEPLEARIPVTRAQGGDLEGLRVALGSPAQFELAGVARLQHLDLLRFGVVGRSDGGGYIRVWTDEPIIESSLTFLIDVDWPRGRAVRGYRLRLSAAPGRTVVAPRTPSVGTGAETRRESDVRPSSPASAPTTTDAATYGPVRPSETLWSIAARFRPGRAISVQRMMLAILEANPGAFDIDNVNALNAGTTLRIPGREDIGSDDVAAAIAEVERQHEAWKKHRAGGRVAPTAPSDPGPSDPGPEPGGRVEVVSPQATSDIADLTGDPDAQALRNQLALAEEEADARRRENDALTLRLAESEDHIDELSRLIELKNEEIAALQAQLRAMADTPPPSRIEQTLTPASPQSQMEPTSTPAPSEESSTSTPAQEPPDGAEPASLPFGLGNLPVNPVFLVGGAGLLLILLGVVALLHRRRASAGEDETSNTTAERGATAELGAPAESRATSEPGASAESGATTTSGAAVAPGPNATASAQSAGVAVAGAPSPARGDNLLVELEAVAADLADDADDQRRGTARQAPITAAGREPDVAWREVARFDSDGPAKEPMAERRAGARETERARSGEADARDDAAEPPFGIDDPSRDESVSDRPHDEASDDFDPSDITDLVALAEASETGARRPVDDSAGDVDDVDRRFRDPDPRTVDSDAPSPAPAAVAGDPVGGDDPSRDEWHAAAPAAPDRDDSVSGLRSVGTTASGSPWISTSATPSGGGPESGSNDSHAPGSAPRVRLGEAGDAGGFGAFPLEDLGEDEIQTKIDLAQVYIEMGDTDSARGFLEAVLTEGDSDQREVAREMLSKLA